MGADGFLKGVLCFLTASLGLGDRNTKLIFRFLAQRFVAKRYKMGEPLDVFQIVLIEIINGLDSYD